MNEYIPQVGDRVQGAEPDWPNHEWIDVIHTTDVFLFGVSERGAPYGAYLDNDWVKVEPKPTVRERWGNIVDGVFYPQPSGEQAKQTRHPARIVAMEISLDGWPSGLHVAVVCDADGNPLPVEVER